MAANIRNGCQLCLYVLLLRHQHSFLFANINISSYRDIWQAVVQMELKTRTLLLRENRQIVQKVMGTFTRDSALPEHLLALAKVLRVRTKSP